MDCKQKQHGHCQSASTPFAKQRAAALRSVFHSWCNLPHNPNLKTKDNGDVALADTPTRQWGDAQAPSQKPARMGRKTKGLCA